MGKYILYIVGNGGRCGCETVPREVIPQVEIPEKWTQEPPCFAITTGVRLSSQTNEHFVYNLHIRSHQSPAVDQMHHTQIVPHYVYLWRYKYCHFSTKDITR